MPNIIIKDKDRRAIVEFLRKDYVEASKLEKSSSTGASKASERTLKPIYEAKTKK